jgi:hypothetical protein
MFAKLFNWFFKKKNVKNDKNVNEIIKKTLNVDCIVGIAPKNEIVDLNKEEEEIKLIKNLGFDY